MLSKLNNPIINSLLQHIPDHLDITNSQCMVRVTEHLNLEVLIPDTVVVVFQVAGVNRFKDTGPLLAICLLTQVHPLKIITLQDY